MNIHFLENMLFLLILYEERKQNDNVAEGSSGYSVFFRASPPSQGDSVYCTGLAVVSGVWAYLRADLPMVALHQIVVAISYHPSADEADKTDKTPQKTIGYIGSIG